MAMPQDRPSSWKPSPSAAIETHGVGKMHFTPELRRLWGFESRDFSEEGIGPDDDFRGYLDAHGFDHVDEPHGLRSEYYYVPQPSQLPPPPPRGLGSRTLAGVPGAPRPGAALLPLTSFIKPHPPFEAPTPWNRLYRCAEMPLPFRPEGSRSCSPTGISVQNRYQYRDAGRDDLVLRTMRAAYTPASRSSTATSAHSGGTRRRDRPDADPLHIRPRRAVRRLRQLRQALHAGCGGPRPAAHALAGPLRPGSRAEAG